MSDSTHEAPAGVPGASGDLGGADIAIPPLALPRVTWREQWRETFRLELRAAGFTRADRDEGVERWEGEITVAWTDHEDGRHRRAIHTIAIELPPGFPFRRPIVRRVDGELVPGREHVISEGGASALCLWVDGRHGWRPWTTLENVLDRVQKWFGHRYRDDWDAEDRPPDIHAYFPTNEGAALVLTGNDWPPPPEARQGRFGMWKRNDFATFAGGPTTSLTAVPSEMPPFREWLSLTRSRDPLPGIGLWYRLAGPPVPSTVFSRLLLMLDLWRGLAKGATLNELRALIPDPVSLHEEQLYFGLGYPDHAGEEHWVFLHVDLSGHRDNWHSAAALEEIIVFGMEAAPATTAAIIRRTGHTAARLAGRRVAVFGAGALGGRIALWLATAGVPALDIVDGDRLRPGNVIRHVSGLSFVGRLKASAVFFEILDHAPDCDIAMHLDTWDESKLSALVETADVVVDATAVPAFALYLNDLCLETGTPFVSAAAFRRALVGRVRITRPGRDACALCYEGGYVPDDPTYPIIPPGEEGAFVESGCGTATVEASALDVDATANAAARAVLHLLRDLHTGATPADAPNHAIIVNEIVKDLASTPHAAAFLTPGIHWSTWARRAGCDACGAVIDRGAMDIGDRDVNEGGDGKVQA